jgi:hypothetical protein
MNRREFLSLTGGVLASAALGRSDEIASSAPADFTIRIGEMTADLGNGKSVPDDGL